ncbi:MAG: hypothetical protein E7612_09635 [Ruminococcaceae bacterium]|nr:hypothetical protein [Oscillospiraceae bacterium]
MKHIQKNKKKPLLIVTLAIFFAIVLTASILIPALAESGGGDKTVSEPPEVLEGEARQNGMPLAYPAIDEKLDIKFIKIENQTGEYGFMVYGEEDFHTLYYVDSSGKQVIYYPEICEKDANFDYSSLFAIVTSDGYGQYTLVDYLCSALQSPYFYARIPIETDEQKAAEQFKNFGFDSEGASTVYLEYVNDLGETVKRRVDVGEKCVTGTGYYFIVYDYSKESGQLVKRPYIYTSVNNYYDYAVSSMNKFVKPLLISDGLSEDSGFGPYLTTGYYQWKNQFHDGSCECDKYTCECRGKCDETDCTCTDVCKVTKLDDTSTVIAFVDVINPTLSEDGYVNTGYDLSELDLFSYKELLDKMKSDGNFTPTYESRNYERVIAALSGREIGKYSGEDEIVYSLVAAQKLIDFSDGATVKYDYKILAVEAIITDSGEISTAGASAGAEHDLVKVSYTASVNGEAQSEYVMHAVIDLEFTAIGSETAEKIRNAKIGEALDVSFEVNYTSENAIKQTSKYVVTEIVDIFDQKGQIAETVTEDSIVGYRYNVYVDGLLVGEASYWLDLSKVTEGNDLKLKNALKGKKTGKITLEFDEFYAYYECMLGFTTFKISEIDSFVTKELVSAFRFQNNSLRDPYYGESLYENLMTDEHRLYGMNSTICEKAVKILGGISADGASATASGLSGDGVVEIGLTPEVMKKYGLYAYTVYFELPRGIKAYTPTDSNESLEEQLDDYTYRSTLGFTLYVSEVDLETNTRYIASDVYNVVTRVSADDFAFLKYDFETFWARRSLMLVDIAYIDKLGVEFCMSDLKGEYSFELTQPEAYRDALGVFVTAAGECTPNKFTEFVENSQNIENGLVYEGGTSLKTFYLYAEDYDEKVHSSVLPDTLGGSCFKDIVKLIFLTSYTDILAEEERESAPNADDLVMRISLDLNGQSTNASPYTYIYEFYRIDDRRVRVSIFQENMSGETVGGSVSDFYVSTFAFKKIVNNFLSLLNAEIPDTDVGYPDEKE